jgi:hypothetical protein
LYDSFSGISLPHTVSTHFWLGSLSLSGISHNLPVDLLNNKWVAQSHFNRGQACLGSLQNHGFFSRKPYKLLVYKLYVPTGATVAILSGGAKMKLWRWDSFWKF